MSQSDSSKEKIKIHRKFCDSRDWVNLQIKLLLWSAARQNVELRSTFYGDGRAKSTVLALRDPHPQECAERRIDPTTYTEYFFSLVEQPPWSSESFILLTSFCNYWILASRKFIDSYSWTLFNSPIWRLLIRVSRWSQFCSDSCSWLTLCHSMINFHSLRINSSSQFLDTFSIRIGLKFVFLDLSSDFSENLHFVSQRESWFARFLSRDFIYVLETSLNLVRLRVSLYLCVWKKDWAGNNLSSWEWLICLRFAGSSRSWMNSGEEALYQWTHRRVPHRTITTVQCQCRRIHRGRSLQKPLSSRSCRAGWAHNLWEGCISPQSDTPHLEGALWV